MKNEERIENGKLIATFMNYPTELLKGRITNGLALTLGYHNRWGALMPVVERIEQETEWELVMGSNDCFWNRFGDRPEGLEGEFSGYRIEAVYTAVVEFIKWYNKQN